MVQKYVSVGSGVDEGVKRDKGGDVVPHFAILLSRRRKRRIAVEARFAVGFARIVKGYA